MRPRRLGRHAARLVRRRRQPTSLARRDACGLARSSLVEQLLHTAPRLRTWRDGLGSERRRWCLWRDKWGLHDGACGHSGLVDAPPASFSDGDSQTRSLGAARAGSRGVCSSSNVFTLHRGGALGAIVSASGCDGSAPEAVRRPDGNDDSREFRLRRARGVFCDRQSSDDGENPSLVVGPHTAPPLSGGDASVPSDDAPVAITSGRDGTTLGAARGVDDGDDSLESRLRRASGALCARQSLDDGANPSLVGGPHTAPLLSGGDASVPSAGMAAALMIDRYGFTMIAERGAEDGDAQ